MDKEVAITGIGEAKAGKRSGKTPFELAAEAAFLAIEDAGLRKDQIDAVFFEHPMSSHHHMPANYLIELLDMQPQTAVSFANGGASPHLMLMQAAGLIRSGVYDTILIVDADGRSTSFIEDKAAAMYNMASDIQEFEFPYGATVPSRYALIAQRHMYEFGTTSEQFAQIAVNERYHASLNPDAIYRNPISVEEVLASPVISSPFHLLECCMVSDWGTAFIMTNRKIAQKAEKPPIWIRGFGGAQLGYNLAPNFSYGPIRLSGEKAFNMAGLTPEQIDVAQIYDSFPITVMIALEGLGFCELGGGGAFVSSGAAQIGGKLPVNTHGGQLSYMCGHGQYILESVRQLRGEAGARQVDGAKFALSQGTAAICSSSYTVIYETI